MLTASRITWFAIAFMFVMPSMLLMFTHLGAHTRRPWVLATVFALAIAMVVATIFGKGDR